MALTLLTSLLWVAQGRYVVAFWWLWLTPLWSILALGSLRARVANGLPLFVLWLYVLSSLYIGDFTRFTWLFYVTPYAAFAFKLNKHPLKWVTLAVSSGLLIYGFWNQNPLFPIIRVLIVLTINVVFFPPIIKASLTRMWHKKTRP